MKFPSLLLLALLLAFTFTLAPHKTIHAAPDGAFVVNNANDADDGQCNASHCSLREAINAANANAGLDAIHFNIGGCPCIIYPNSQLPEITDPVIINGYTENGAAPADNHNPAVLKIMLRGYNTPNLAAGLMITGGGSTVKGLVINTFIVGIWLRGNGGNTIEGNYIGTFWNGKAAAPNEYGIFISHGSSQNIVGGNFNASQNIISGNQVAGIRIDSVGGSAERNVVIGNNIGQGVDDNALGNGTGIVIRAPKNTIGSTGSPSFAANRISSNLGVGIELNGSNAKGNVIMGNAIGSIDSADSGNGTYGVLIHNGARKNKIGKPGNYNFIAYNGADGVAVIGETSRRNSIRGNYFSENGGLGIDLGDDGVTTNDALDVDNGSNTLVNFPVIKSFTLATKRVKGRLAAAPNSSYNIDVYVHIVCDPHNHGEGIYVETFKVTTNAHGIAKFNVVLAADIQDYAVIMGVAVDKQGNTSEFGKCVPISP